MRITVLLLTVLVLVPLFSVQAQAKDVLGWPTISLTAGGYDLDGADLQNEPLYGIQLGYEFGPSKKTEHFALELVGQNMKGEDAETGQDLDVSIVRLDAFYFFSQIKSLYKLTPFLTVGGGARLVDIDGKSDNNALACYGIGARLPITPSLALRIEGRQMLVLSDPHQTDYSYTLGLQWTFGKTKPKAQRKAVVTTDSDNDGIFDNVDQCPETPMGLKVNARGCPVNPPDADKDKVPDYLDLCPETAAGLEVNKDGCLEDTDGDGVPDIYDKCPNNPPGFKVNPDGCM